MNENDRGAGSGPRPGDDEPTISSADLRSASETQATRSARGETASGQVREIPESIAGYRILGVLGEGGMGVVWEAEQERPKRRVALKVMRRDHQVDELHQRLFHREAETLARLKHPNIAAIYESGHTDSGHDYFAMELVQGRTLDRWLAERPDRLDSSELELRLALFGTICDAVHYAHQRGVIHRDLKPANIIVADETDADAGGSSHAGAPAVKILDFGLARITDADVAATQVSEIGMIKGTLQYMSPEQARGDVDAIDVRTDVYALGVMLYEMLTGRRPYEVTRAALAEAVRVICEDRPEPLRRSSSGAGRLDSDLETIVGKALEKDVDRRYGSAAALADDIERHMQSQPIQARPPSAVYQLRKMVQRNRLAAAFAATVLVLIVVLAVTSNVQANATARERDRAEAEAAKAGAMNSFLSGMLTSTDPWAGGDHDMTVVEALDTALEQVDSAFAEQPLVEAEMRAVLGSTYLGLLRLEPAEEQTRRALEMKIELLGPDHPELAEIWSGMCSLARRRGAYDEAIASARECLRIRRLQHPGPHREVVEALQQLARNLNHARRFDEAEAVIDECEEMIRSLDGDFRSQLAENLVIRADLMGSGRGDLEEAASLLAEALELGRAHDPDDPQNMVSLNNLAVYTMYQGKLGEARALYEELLTINEQRFGLDHPEYATSLENLANVNYRQKRYDEALAALERVRAIRARNLGEGHVDVIRTTLNMAVVAANTGREERALELYDQLIPDLRSSRGDHPDTALALRNKADTLRRLERLSEAESSCRESLAIYMGLFAEDHVEVARTRLDLGITLTDQHRWSEAEVELTLAFPILESTYGADHARTRKAAKALVEVYQANGRTDRAEEYRGLLGVDG